MFNLSTPQTLALLALAGVTLFTYVLPHIPAGFVASAIHGSGEKKKVDTLSSIEDVLAIRDSTEDKALIDACNAVLQALIQVRK